MITFYAPKELEEHKKFGVSNGVLYSIPPNVHQKEWNTWNWEKREISVENIPLDANYEGPVNPFGASLEIGDTDYMGNVSSVYVRRQGRDISPKLDEEAVQSEDRHGRIWHARSLFRLWENPA